MSEAIERNRRKAGTGTWLLLGAAALAIPGVVLWLRLPQDIAGNERSAAQAVKTFASVQADFRANDRDGNGVLDFWTGDVAGFLRYGLIERSVAEADARPLKPLVAAPIAHRGYYFVAMSSDESEDPPESLLQETDKTSGKVHHRERFGFCAYPVRYGVTGRNTFIVNEGNSVFWRHTDGEPMLHWPSDQDLRHEWRKGD